MFQTYPKYTAVSLLLACLLGAASLQPAHADASEASALSLLPAAVVSGGAMTLLQASGALVLVGVEESGQGVEWVVERVSDGARASLKLAGKPSVAIGTAVLVTAMSAGWVLSSNGKAVGWIPNESGASLLHNERVSR